MNEMKLSLSGRDRLSPCGLDVRVIVRGASRLGMLLRHLGYSLIVAILIGPRLLGVTQRPPEPAQPLEPGRSIEDTLEPDQTKSFRIATAAGQYSLIAIDTTRLDLDVRLVGPHGTGDIAVENAAVGGGPVAFSLLSQDGGNFRLDVQRRARRSGEGRYRVTLSEPRPARADDEKRAVAERTFWQAERRRADRSMDALRERLASYERALSLWRDIADRRNEALALNRTGTVHADLGETKEAQECLLQALSVSRSEGDLRVLASTLVALGRACEHRGELLQGLDYYQRALPFLNQTGDESGEAATLVNIGATYAEMGDASKAIEWYVRALPFFHAPEDRSREATTLANISAAYRELGEPQKGMDYLQRALALGRAAGDRGVEAALLRMMGAASYDLSDLQKALDYYTQALPLQRAVGDVRQEAVTLASLGLVYDRLGETERAMESFRQSLTLRERMDDRRGQAISLAHIGLCYVEEGETSQALPYYQRALALHRAVANRKGEADTLVFLGDVYVASNQLQKAVEHYNQALSFYRSTGHAYEETGALTSLGSVNLALHETQQAFEYLNEALHRARALESRFQEAEILFDLARAERMASHLSDALARINEALELTERQRGTVVGADARASYFARVRGRYEFLIAVLMRLHDERPAAGFAARAFEASERARARSLIDLLGESRVDIREGVDPALLERERSLDVSLAAKTTFRVQLLAGKHSDEQVNDLEREIAALTAQYDEVEAQIRARSPRYAALTQPKVLTVDDVQQHLLDRDTLLLEYSLGDEHSFVWAVTEESLVSYQLPGRAAIEAAARRAYEELSINAVPAPRDATDALARVLIAPVAGHLGKKRLVVVADGALQYVPFAALRTSQGAPLIVGHEIVTLPSASTLTVLRHETEGRKRAPKLVAVLADPVFEASDSRVSLAASLTAHRPARSASSGHLDSARASTSDELERSARDAAVLRLERLVSSRHEAKAIVALAGQDSSWEALDFDASRTSATSTELSQYRTVHVASHALLNSKHPALSGIVLSLVDRNGRPQDGFLQARDIYNLRLNADLVVLSACQTALGKEVRGEGLIGLTRAFMYAGAPRVVASLWRVPDRATAELMRAFYEGMLREGLPPAAALRNAQVALSKDTRWSAPYYWSGFTLQGEWK